MSLADLGEYTRVAKYAKYLPQLKRRELWPEQVSRMMDMHRVKYADLLDVLNPYIDYAQSALLEKQVIGSQRGLQFGGAPILNHHARIYNCAATYIDRPRVFQEFFYLALCGCGVGFSVQKHHVAKLPTISKRKTYVIEYFVEDSIEGWADALGVLVSSYFDSNQPFPEMHGKGVIKFNYEKIRPAGAMLSSGFKAPGPDGLRKSINRITEIFEQRLNDGHSVLRPIDAYDILMHCADAVVSGGVRRAATLCMFSKDDEKMMRSKTGDWRVKNPQRGRSNNSVALIKSEVTAKEFEEIMHHTKEFGEPGFVFVENSEHIVNPCCEISFYCVDPQTLETGFGFCNLSEINMVKCKTVEEYYAACRAAAILGTLQAGYTDFKYLTEASKNIARRESLLGVSMTGIMDNPAIALNPEILAKGAEIVKDVNAEVAAILGINIAARSTCVKPSGSASSFLGVSSGVHPQHSKRYLRLVQANVLEAPLQYFRSVNPMAVEKSVWDPNNVTDVISFVCEVPTEASIFKNDVSALDLLSSVKLIQNSWVKGGTRKELCLQPWLIHNVSNTITVKDSEWEAVRDYIYSNREFFCGISLLAHAGDKDYPQAPFTTVYTPEEIIKMYGDAAIIASGVIERALNAFKGDLWAACDCILGRGEPITPKQVKDKIKEDFKIGNGNAEYWRNLGLNPDSPSELLTAWLKHSNSTYPEKHAWVTKASAFADKYFAGDLRKMSYCLKDVYNWKKWIDLRREWKPVDWTNFHEEDDNVKFEDTVACAGGACSLI